MYYKPRQQMHRQFSGIDPTNPGVAVSRPETVRVHLVLPVPLEKFRRQSERRQCQHCPVILMDLNISIKDILYTI